MLKKIYSVFVLLTLLIISPVCVFGQVTPTAEDNFAVQINVLDIKVATSTVSAGEILTGEVVVNNAYINDVSDLNLSFSVVNNLNDLSFGRVFSASKSESFNLQKGEFKTIPFSITLPVAGDDHKNGLAIDVVNKSGDILGSNTLPLTIKGLKPFVLISRLYLDVNDTGFLLQEGPTVKQGDTATFNATINASSTLKAIPHIRIYDFDTTNTLLKESKLPEVNVIKNTPKEFSFDLETFDYKPGVYEGSLVMEDGSGNPVSDIIEFRYVVWGEMATLRNISADKYFGKRGEVVHVSVEAFGAPYDLLEKKAPLMGDLSLELNLFTSRGEQVGSAKEIVNFDADPIHPFLKNVPVTLKGNANTLILKASLKNSEGKILAYREVNLSGDQVGTIKSNNNLLLVLGTLLSILVAVILLVLKKKKILVILFVFGLLSISSSVSANGSVNPGVVAPGANYTVTETCSFGVCRNANGSIRASVDGSSDTNNWGVEYCGKNKNGDKKRCEDSPSRTTTKSVVFRAGAPGTYYHRVRCEMYQGGDTSYTELENTLVAVQVVCPYNSTWNGTECFTNGVCDTGIAPASGSLGGGVLNGGTLSSGGGSSGSFVTSAPTSNLCRYGSPSSVSSNPGSYSWNCNGVGSGSNTASCSVSNGKGVCGSSYTTSPQPSYSTAPSSNLCNGGTPSSVTKNTTNSTWNWTCVGANTASLQRTAYCSVPSSNATTTPVTPTPTCFDPHAIYPGCDTCVSGYKPCSGSCIPTSSSCVIPTSTCSISSLTSSISPSFVASPTDTCTASWNASGVDSVSGGQCSTNISCTIDGGSPLAASSSKSGLSVGTHTIRCVDASGTPKTASVKCKVNPTYGEF